MTISDQDQDLQATDEPEAMPPEAPAEDASAPEAVAAAPEAQAAEPEAQAAEPAAPVEAATAESPEASESIAAIEPGPAAAVAAVSAPEAPSEAAVESAEAPPARRGRPRTRLEDISVGSEMRGKVVGVAKYGAFVDIGAMTDGLVHVTELPKRGRNVRPEDQVKSGEVVDVWVKEVDVEKGRVSLSMRRPPANPMADLKVGAVLSGTVMSTTKYGAFIDIGSETEGLVHISEMSSGFVQRPEDVVKKGDTVEVRVKEVDAGSDRISLSMVGLSHDPGLEEALAQKAAAQAARQAEAEYAMPEEPQERVPTVVELALRRALGELDGEAEAEVEAEAAPEPAPAKKPAAKKKAPEPQPAALDDVYSRMLEEYRASKAAEK